MKLLIPVLSSYARHGGVTQFLSNFSQGLDSSSVLLFDYQGPISGPIKVSSFGKLRLIVRKIKLLKFASTFKNSIKDKDHVFLNPSLGDTSMRREMYYASKCIENDIYFSVFFHGWNKKFESYLSYNEELRNRYCDALKEAKCIFVLSGVFKNKLVEWGVPSGIIHLESTMIDDSFLPNCLEDDTAHTQSSRSINLLFLSRVFKEKGIFEALQAFKLHVQRYPDSTFTIAGNGEDLDAAKKMVVSENIRNVSFFGFANEQEKKQLLADHDVFILPSYSEGMPISIFEAMAYKLAVVTRPVGGIPDFFEDEKMGRLIESLDPSDFASALDDLTENSGKRKRIGCSNQEFVIKNMTSSVVVKRIVDKISG